MEDEFKMFTQLKFLYTLISGSKLLWKVIRNWRVLSNSLESITNILKNMNADDRHLPNSMESSQLILCFSNILKTGVIDIPGIDEYQISLDLDNFSSSLMLSIEDSKSGKFHDIVVTKTKKEK